MFSHLTKRSNTGLLITLDGLDGCGKSTQAERLCMYCAANNIPFIHVQQPGGTELTDIIRNFVKTKDVKDETLLLLMLTSWVDTFTNSIYPALMENKVVISERGWSSFLAYQGFGAGNYDLFGQNSAMHSLLLSLLARKIHLVFKEHFIYLRKSKEDRASMKNIESDKLELLYGGMYKSLEVGYEVFDDGFNILANFPHVKTQYTQLDCGDMSIESVTDHILHALNSSDNRFEPLRYYQG